MDSQNQLDQFLNEYKIPLAISLVGLVLLIGGVISSGIIPKTFIKSTPNQPLSINGSGLGAVHSPAPLGTAKVDVSGEVAKPGVYTLALSSRVEDALKMAGGVTESADPVYVSKSLNLAQKISDGMKIYIPRVSEAGSSGTSAGTSDVAGAKSEIININSASLSELDRLPGVGPVTAQKIIDGRPFGGLEDLVTKKVVTRSVYEKIKDKVSIW